jgi:hypothetical protein
MRFAAIAILVLAAACSRETRPDPAPGKVVPAVLLTCAIEPPTPSSSSGSGRGDASADFQVDARGRVRDVHVQGAKGSYAKALRRHLESCEYSPGLRDGRPVATRRAAVYSANR